MTIEQNFLDEFLKLQLLDIGDEDGRFANLQAASAVICDHLKADLHQLARYTRVGLDKDIDPDEPVLDEVEAAIMEQWKLIRNKHVERPVSIVRAVLWEAVRIAVDEDANAVVVSLTARAESDDSNLGPEADACQRFLCQVATRAERLAEAEWTGRPELANANEGKTASAMNASLLEEKLLAACGPEGPDGAIKGANPHWPAENAAWSSEFSQRAAKGISDVVDKHLDVAHSALEGVAQQLATEIHEARRAVSRKTDLLWWSQSRFCVTTATGFSDIPTPALPFFLAADIQLLAPGLCPQSVDHFLAHAVQTAAPKSKKIAVRQMIEALVNGDFSAAIAETVRDAQSLPGRCGVITAVKRALSNPASLDEVERQLAIGSRPITLSALAKRVFWELKAANVAASVPSGDAGE